MCALSVRYLDLGRVEVRLRKTIWFYCNNLVTSVELILFASLMIGCHRRCTLQSDFDKYANAQYNSTGEVICIPKSLNSLN